MYTLRNMEINARRNSSELKGLTSEGWGKLLCLVLGHIT